MEALKSISISGRYTLEEALGIILKDTSLSGELTTEGVILITPIQKKSDRGREMKSKKKILAATIGFFMGAGGASYTLADEAKSSEGMDRLLEEVIVTAQKREQRSVDVPISLTVLSGEELVNAGIADIGELPYLVPNFSVIDSVPGRNNYYIRGVGNSLGSSPLVGVYFDEIPLSVAPGISVDVSTLDLERAEVLKGPQGTLFGQGSVGGTVRLLSKDPEFGGGIKGEVGFSAQTTKDGDIGKGLTAISNIPVTDSLAFRIAATYKDEGGWIDQPTGNKDNVNDSKLESIRIKGMWQITDELTTKATVIRHRNDLGGRNYSESETGSTYRVTPVLNTELASTAHTNNYDIYNLEFNLDLGFATFISSTSHLDTESIGDSQSAQFDFDAPTSAAIGASSLDRLITDSNTSTDALSQEFRLSGNSEKLDWIVGTYYSDLSTDGSFSRGWYDNGVIVLGATPLEISGSGTSKSQAYFVDVNYAINERLTLGIGTRYFENDKSDKVTVGAFNFEAKGSFNNLSSKVSLSYALNDKSNIYLNVSEGFRSGGTNAGTALLYKPEELTSFELGVKSILLENALIAEAAIYHSVYSDYQFNSFDINTGLQAILNPGEAEVDGFEFSLQLKPLDYFSLGVNGNYTEAEFVKISSGGTGGAFFVGDPLNFIPKYSFSFNTSYDFNWSQSVLGFARIDYSIQGPSTAAFKNQGLAVSVSESDPVKFLNFQIGAEKDNIAVKLSGKNMTNELGSLEASVNSQFQQRRPRTYSIDFSYKF
jgi:outer membrane receptor protein involved in Fe transport